MKDNVMHSHIPMADMLKYRDGMLDRAYRDKVDGALASCEECLAVFMAVLEAKDSRRGDENDEAVNSPWIPAMPDMEKMADSVIDGLLCEEGERLGSDEYAEGGNRQDNCDSPIARTTVRRRTWLQHPAAHYTIAASITLMLLASGAFAGLSEKLRELDMASGNVPGYEAVHEPQEIPEPSWSERMLNRTGSWIDRIQSARFQ
ncbi:hypothetical protein M6D81_18670 [Paenibacillus sp. J5C_2022]|uniref:hypothetical protein n=1 Tax=Paenibacillus sp. J5C2022 TaxID=2977129 RepID=UPI0021D0B100|nr:hypothetical protein [Paenibacillus sp. J5C2022]MCU6710718.1 hypothetical protein [Paenibacillus sp. J5C2022]